MTPTAPLPMLPKPNKQVGLRVHSAEWAEIQALARQHDLKVGGRASGRVPARFGTGGHFGSIHHTLPRPRRSSVRDRRALPAFGGLAVRDRLPQARHPLLTTHSAHTYPLPILKRKPRVPPSTGDPSTAYPPPVENQRFPTGCYGALHRQRRTGDQQIELSKRKKVRTRTLSKIRTISARKGAFLTN